MELMLVQRPPRLRRSPDVVVDGPFPGSRRAPTPGQPPTHLLEPARLTPEGWGALVAGLRWGRGRVREQFLAALVEAHAAGRDVGALAEEPLSYADSDDLRAWLRARELPPEVSEVFDLSESPDAHVPPTPSVDELESVLRAMPPRQGRRDAVLEAARALARLDRERVLPFVDALLARPATDERHRLGRALRHFPVEGQLSARLDALGVTPARPLQEPEGLTIEEELQRRGRLDFFGNEADRDPIAHDLLLYELAALAPGLEAAEFDQEPPNQAPRKRRFYRLHAYLEGAHHTLEATDYREYVDVESCMALVNALLAAQSSAWRLAQVAPRDDWAAYVVAGPREALLALEREGALPLVGSASQPPTAGAGAGAGAPRRRSAR